VKLTTYLHLVPRSRMNGAILPLPHYVFMAWYCDKSAGATLPLTHVTNWKHFAVTSQDSLVSTAKRLQAGRAGFDFRQGQDISLRHRVQNGSGAHPDSSPMSTGGSFPGGEATGTWSWPLTSMWCRGWEYKELDLNFPNTPSWRGA
jgi:hypothetical protein